MGIYASVYNDSYSRFIANRDVDYGAGCTIGEAGTAYFYSSKFILNSARYQGGVVISRQSSFTLMEGVEVLGNYAEVGAVFSITERSAFIINNCKTYLVFKLLGCQLKTFISLLLIELLIFNQCNNNFLIFLNSFLVICMI